MADRFFPNEMPDYIPETSGIISETADGLTKLLHLPFKSVCELLKNSALDLKDAVVRETWINSEKRVQDYTLYTGALGTAFLLFKAYQVISDKHDLALSSQIIKACDSASRASKNVTFICGRSGVCALGAVVAKQAGDEHLFSHYLSEFNQIRLPSDLPYELLYGKVGFLWSCSFLNKHIGEGTVSNSTMREIFADIIKAGRNSGKGRCPLMYEWHGKKYWGAAHGLAGILHVLMDMQMTTDEQEDVKSVLRYMIKGRFPSGNYPSSEGSESDRLVHWCHGAPGITLTLAKAYQVFGNKEFLQAAVDAGEVVWNRGLLKRVGICHGISGNTYVFLALYRITGDAKYLYRAKAFASFLLDKSQRLIAEGFMHCGDRPYSLFEGLGGTAHLFFDMIETAEARFPAYEL
ncbi:lanC-like protein GCR2 isoform X2 [Amaranthus tricolor]|uniref:lanC-like protein GCR2 isoform X2 n=1 Tax=Amaranthus tricolor TaxID=29722 RepID=UPI0025906332|nr:lanC-like protein GCR2 isoform X2 [Amaranthus tricolor]